MSDASSGWKDFIKLCRDVQDEVLVAELLDFLFTHEEKNNIATRILLVRELMSGEKTQREIAKDLKVSIAKITRGSNSLKRISPQLRRFLEREI